MSERNWTKADDELLILLLHRHPNDVKAVVAAFNDGRAKPRSVRALEYRAYVLQKQGVLPHKYYALLLHHRRHPEQAQQPSPEFKRNINAANGRASDTLLKIMWVFDGMALGSINDAMALSLIRELTYGQ